MGAIGAFIAPLMHIYFKKLNKLQATEIKNQGEVAFKTKLKNGLY